MEKPIFLEHHFGTKIAFDRVLKEEDFRVGYGDDLVFVTITDNFLPNLTFLLGKLGRVGVQFSFTPGIDITDGNNELAELQFCLTADAIRTLNKEYDDF